MLVSLVLPFLGLVSAQSTQPAPGQPSHHGNVGGFEIIGNSLVSAQQLFLGTLDKVYFVDKVENNPTQINGHPAWASEWSLSSNQQRAMDALTNTFCAGGNVLGNGTWINVGGNQAVTSGGNAADSQTGGPPYDDPDGRTSIRMLDPCDDGNCDWHLAPTPSGQRWYPTLETLEDGSILILGGCTNGGYVNDANQDNPTYEFYPPRGPAITSPILTKTLPVNLFPLTWLLPSGRLLIQSNWRTALLDYRTNTETPLDNMPNAVRVYPASAGTVMLPLTPANKYTATILFCGGSNIDTDRWTSPGFMPVTIPAATSCVTLTPDASPSYQPEDELRGGQSMSNLILLPNGQVLNLNGARMGTAGYGNDAWAIGHSYADVPVLEPALFDPAAQRGHRWTQDGLQQSTVPRLYHSSALLLPDGSVFVSGSNPNPDYAVGQDVRYPTEYRSELFYPPYYNERRPQPNGIPTQLSYGGPAFGVVLNADDLSHDISNVNSTKVVIIRPGFSTHSMNMGQRYVELAMTYTAYAANSTAILHVSQLPPNAAVLAPGPALIFVVVKGVPSVGLKVMIGSGQLGTQTMLETTNLPTSTLVPQANVAQPNVNKASPSGATSHLPVGGLLTFLLSLLVSMILHTSVF
ncbi:copper radical oxidase [Crepidotus variabilis]|uniref:Copper radical oxidase n=1 Tax=Crepidotus variabilis TaxID=179855 RepID=A0A9P6EED5_9AGAR|nr:copper radical oxidase [Crepidotus variabilis]